MMPFDRISLGRQAKDLGFIRDTFEKVCRLADVLSFMENDPLLSSNLALKGGTAINLTVFELPRLSVDIDLDFTNNVSREVMLQERQKIGDHFGKYMTASGYVLSQKSKQYHALDSFVYEYVNAGGMRDNIKIEINYMLRCHVLPVSRRKTKLSWLDKELTVLCLHPVEVFSAKTVALLNRSAARDLYDMFNLQKFALLGPLQETLYKKCVMFYSAIASETVPEHFEFWGIRSISAQKIKRDLVPVLRQSEHFELEAAQEQVETYLKGILLPEGNTLFWEAFSKGEYKPQLLFDDEDILSRIENHPMALWKCRNI